MVIKHSEDVFGSHEAYLAKLSTSSKVATPEIPTDTSSLTTINAYINRGNWVVDCPSQNCYSSYYASREQAFYCFRCQNRDNDGAFYAVAFPLEKEEIEKTLTERSLDKNKNWYSTERLDDLKLETRFNGDKIQIKEEKERLEKAKAKRGKRRGI